MQVSFLLNVLVLLAGHSALSWDSFTSAFLKEAAGLESAAGNKAPAGLLRDSPRLESHGSAAMEDLTPPSVHPAQPKNELFREATRSNAGPRRVQLPPPPMSGLPASSHLTDSKMWTSVDFANSKQVVDAEHSQIWLRPLVCRVALQALNTRSLRAGTCLEILQLLLAWLNGLASGSTGPEPKPSIEGAEPVTQQRDGAPSWDLLNNQAGAADGKLGLQVGRKASRRWDSGDDITGDSPWWLDPSLRLLRLLLKPSPDGPGIPFYSLLHKATQVLNVHPFRTLAHTLL